MRTVDEVLHSLGISTVDFIKLDVEGAELRRCKALPGSCAGLRGPQSSRRCRTCAPSPGDTERGAIVEFLANLDYRWFALAPDSSLRAISIELDSTMRNLVALPCERAREFRSLGASVNACFFPCIRHDI